MHRINKNTIKQNTIFYILHSIRKNSEYYVKILNSIVRLSGVTIDPEDEELIVKKFKKFNKDLLYFSKFNFGTTLNLCSKKYVEYEILKDSIMINNYAIELHTSLKYKLITYSKINGIHLELYISAFNVLLNESSNVFKDELKYIKKFSKKQAYIDKLDQIIPILELIKTRFLDKLV